MDNSNDKKAGAADTSPVSSSASPRLKLIQNSIDSIADKASCVLESGKALSPVISFGVNHLTRVVYPVTVLSKWQWNCVGQPLVTYVDDKIDTVYNSVIHHTAFHPLKQTRQQQQQQPSISGDQQILRGLKLRRRLPTIAIDDIVMQSCSSLASSSCSSLSFFPSASASSPASSPPSTAVLDSSSIDHMNNNQNNMGTNTSTNDNDTAFWAKLKLQFVNSRWFTTADEILRQNPIFKAMQNHIVHPAELFFNTVLSCFARTVSLPDFLGSLRRQLACVWDPRLEKLATSFFSTATAVINVQGARRFFSGAIQLGKQTISGSIDTLLTGFDQVLKITDRKIDQWLPDKDASQSTPSMSSSSPSKDVDMDINPNPSSVGIVPRVSVAETDNKYYLVPVEVETQHLSIIPIVKKITKRIFQRLPDLRKLLSDIWFVRVDQILLENSLMRSLVEGFPSLVRPSEHFYRTLVSVYTSGSRTLSSLLNAVRETLRKSYDTRLGSFISEFYNHASSAKLEDVEMSDDENEDFSM